MPQPFPRDTLKFRLYLAEAQAHTHSGPRVQHRGYSLKVFTASENLLGYNGSARQWGGWF
jgi:hypothetical protein